MYSVEAQRLVEFLESEFKKNPEVREYSIIWSNAVYTEIEVRHEGRWIRLGRLPKTCGAHSSVG